MATTYKVLGQSAPAATTATTIYTVPASTEAIVSTIFICNRGATSATYRIALREGGAALVDKHYLVFDAPAAGNDTTTITSGITMSAGDLLIVYASNANLTFNVSGSEIS